MQNNPGSVFPSSTFGEVRALSFDGQPVTSQSVPSPPPTTLAPASWYTPGRIAGIVVGSVVGLVLLAAAVVLIVRSRLQAARKRKVAAGYNPERSALM